MNSTNTIEVRCHPANPVNYLACCGVFDLLSRLDDSAKGHWKTQAPVRFVLETPVPEQDLVQGLLDTFCSRENWRFESRPGSEEVIWIKTRFAWAGRGEFQVCFDWWYETLKANLAIDGKSAWKMYAGQQTVEKITSDMIEACRVMRSSDAHLESVSALLEASVNMTGRFGLDPRSSRNALDVGYSHNDLQMPVATYPFAEMLAVIGANAFFPHRTGQAGKLDSTRGWTADDRAGRGFSYRLWPDPQPVNLARVAALRSHQTATITLFSVRAYRKNYSNLTLANPTQITRANV